MMCTIDGKTFFSFTKNTWIGCLGASCHITNDNNGIYVIINIDKSIQGNSRIMPAMNKGKLQVIVVKYPVITSSIMTTSHTKHMDIQYEYVNKYVEDGIVKIIFVNSADNNSNILTKNLSSEFHEKHAKKMVIEKLEDCCQLQKYLN